MKTLLPFLILILIFILKKIFFKFQFLLSNTGDEHQNFANKSSVPLVGGLLIFFSFIFIFIDNLTFFFSFFLLLIFLLGTLSDLKLTSSARTRLIFQLIITFIYIYLSDLRLSSTGIHFLDRANNFYYFNYFFVCFCLLILINGSNFIDGLNGLCLGYYLLIILFLFKNDFNNTILTDKSDLIILFLSLLVILFFNYLNKIFIGDNGSYILSAIFGINLIQIYNENNFISSFYIILLLWYPCFELLFSILRKYNFKKLSMTPDNDHLHHLIFYIFSKKYKISNLSANNWASSLILFYNFIIFYLGSINILHSQSQIFLIFISVLIYCVLYLKLFAWKKRLLKKK